jgi:hypothetical protein
LLEFCHDVHFLAGGRLWTCKGDEVFPVDDEKIRGLSLLSLKVLNDQMFLVADAGERGQALWRYGPEEEVHHITPDDIAAQRYERSLANFAQAWLDEP